MSFRTLPALILLGWGSYTYAQPANDDCAQAQTLCAGNVVHGSNQGATSQICAGCPDGPAALGTFCYAVHNSVWFTFTTNSTGGAAVLSMSNLSCLVIAGMDNELEVSVLSATVPCNSNGSYAVVACSVTPFSSGTNLSLTGLLPSTTYYVHIDGDLTGSGITQPAQCDFDISISGTAVDPQVQTTITNSTCSNNDGIVTVTSVNPFAAPLSYSLNGSPFQPGNSFSSLPQGNYNLVIQDANGCTAQQNVVIGLNGGPQDGTPSITNATGCNTNTGSIAINGVTGGTGPYSYSLNGGPGQASNTFSNLPPGMYNVTVTDNTACSYTYANLVVGGTGGITNIQVSVIQPDCANPTGTITLTPVGGTPVYNYMINGVGPVTNNVFSGLAPGSYNFLVFDALACTYFISLVVVENPVPVLQPYVAISPAVLTSCQGSNATFWASAVNGGSTPVFTWQVNGSTVQSGSSASYSSSLLNNGDVVTCILISTDPCVIQSNDTSNAVTVSILPQVNPTLTVTPSSTQACEGDVITVTTNVTGCPTGAGTYTWILDGIPVSTDTSSQFVFTAGSTTEVSAQFLCDDPCSNTASSPPQTVSVTQVNVDAGPDVMIGEGESTVLQGSGNGTFSWTPSGTLSSSTNPGPVATPAQTTTYTLTVTYNGCSASDDVTVVVTPLIVIPNTFSPNGDGYNDTWNIHRVEFYSSCQVTVYDRWGQKVYNSTGYRNENAWEGTYLGGKLPAGAYYYVIELNDGKSTNPYMGWVAIIY